MQSGEESSSSGHFNPVGHLQQSGCLGSYNIVVQVGQIIISGGV